MTTSSVDLNFSTRMMLSKFFPIKPVFNFKMYKSDLWLRYMSKDIVMHAAHKCRVAAEISSSVNWSESYRNICAPIHTIVSICILFISSFLFCLVKIVECVHELSVWLKFNSGIYNAIQLWMYILCVCTVQSKRMAKYKENWWVLRAKAAERKSKQENCEFALYMPILHQVNNVRSHRERRSERTSEQASDGMSKRWNVIAYQQIRDPLPWYISLSVSIVCCCYMACSLFR